MQKVAADAFVVGLHLDTPAIERVVIPVKQHGAKARDQAVDNMARLGLGVIVFLRQATAEHRAAGSHHVHWMRGSRQDLEGLSDGRGQSAQRPQLMLISSQLRSARQLAMHDKVGYLLELAGLSKIEDVIAAIVQIVAGPAHGTYRSIAGSSPRKSHRFLGFRQYGFTHC